MQIPKFYSLTYLLCPVAGGCLAVQVDTVYWASNKPRSQSS